MKKILLMFAMILLLAGCGPNEEDPPTIVINGDAVIELSYGDDYVDQGAYIEDNDELELKTSGEVDTLIEGTYYITYWYELNEEVYSATRTIVVDDPLSIVFRLEGESTQTIEIGDGYTDPGVYISDTTLIHMIEEENNINFSEIGTYELTFTITYEGVTRTLTRTIEIVERTSILFYLLGEDSVTISRNSVWTDPGYYMSDDSISVITQGTVDTTTVGTYTISYYYVEEGEPVSLIRTVIVE